MPKRFILSLVIAFVAAVFLTKGADRRPFAEIVERAEIAVRANAPGSMCPLSRETIERSDVELLSICLAHGLGAFDVARRYPVQAAKVFAVYREEEVFWQVLDRYGHEVIPSSVGPRIRFSHSHDIPFSVRGTYTASALRRDSSAA
jgi:hypothetical protein